MSFTADSVGVAVGSTFESSMAKQRVAVLDSDRNSEV